MGRCQRCEEEVTPVPRVIDQEFSEAGGVRVREWTCPECSTILGVSEAQWVAGSTYPGE